MQSAYSLAQWLSFTLLVFSMQTARLSLHITNVFQMTGLLRRTYLFNEQATKYVSIYLNDLKPQVKIGTSSGYAVLNDTQWFILVTFKGHISKTEVRELGDSRHTLSMYYGRCNPITSENTQVYLSKNDWSQLMDLAGCCIDRQVIKFCTLQGELVDWRKKCFEHKSF
jgi:hypothetical protein